MTPGDKQLVYEQEDEYSTIRLLPTLTNAQWNEIERAGTEIIGELNEQTHPHVIIDLTELDYMHSAMVAMLVRFWKTIKSRDGKMAVVNKHPLVGEVLKLAGLQKVWDIFGSREDAMDHLGLSVKAKTERRESRLVSVTGPIIALAAVVVFASHFFAKSAIQPDTWKLIVWACGGFGAVICFIGLTRGGTLSKLMSCVMGLAAVGVVVGTFLVKLPESAPPPGNADGDEEQNSPGDPGKNPPLAPGENPRAAKSPAVAEKP